MLKHEYKEIPTLEEALQLAIKVLNKTLDSTKLSAEKGRCALIRVTALRIVMCVVEIATLTRQTDENKTVIKVLPGTEVDTLISAYYEEEERKKEEKAREEKARQEKAAASST